MVGFDPVYSNVLSVPRIFPPLPRVVPWRNLKERPALILGRGGSTGTPLDTVSAAQGTGAPLTALHSAGLSGLDGWAQGGLFSISEIYAMLTERYSSWVVKVAFN